MIGIHREVRGTLIVVAVICLIFVAIIYFIWPCAVPFGSVLALGLFIFVLSFFRIPKRDFRTQLNRVISPCDGKVVVIEEVTESEFIAGRCRQISVFMSPLNVHINWHPVSGQVVYKKYHPGKYLVAWHPKSSTENERMSVGYQFADDSKILVRQIAGAMARRIVNYAEVDQDASAATEMGFIKFGSRVDVFVPLDYPLQVAINDRVIGGVTPLATVI